MGSIITLGLGNLEIDWGKTHNFIDHSALFTKGKLGTATYKYFDLDELDKVIYERQPALLSPLKDVVPRLELLGYTVGTAKSLYYEAVDLGYVSKDEILPFEEVLDALQNLHIKTLPLNYQDREHDPGKFVEREILDLLKLLEKDDDFDDDDIDMDRIFKRRLMGEVLENLHPWAILRLLAENPENLDIPVVWFFHDVVEGGWVNTEDIVKPVSQECKFILVTEGSSDTHILKKAISTLQPKISDFFTFIDMEEGYPFTGIGNLHNFCQGLAKIGVINNILAIYDNDIEGTSKFVDAQELQLPQNMRIMKLPFLDEFKAFKTIGPTGESIEDINGKAVAIECYLDLNWESENEAVVRWSGFNKRIKQYQGELVAKEKYTKKFLRQKQIVQNYDYSKLEKLIGEIYIHCVDIAQAKIKRSVI